MDPTPEIIITLRDMRRELTDNHLEVCQRLSVLETAREIYKAPTADLEHRVKKLEGWRSKIVGGMIFCNAAAAAALAYFRRS